MVFKGAAECFSNRSLASIMILPTTLRDPDMEIGLSVFNWKFKTLNHFFSRRNNLKYWQLNHWKITNKQFKAWAKYASNIVHQFVPDKYKNICKYIIKVNSPPIYKIHKYIKYTMQHSQSVCTWQIYFPASVSWTPRMMRNQESLKKNFHQNKINLEKNKMKMKKCRFKMKCNADCWVPCYWNIFFILFF